jgi:excisionase family DNA binding protein
MNRKAFSPAEAATIAGVGRTMIFAEIKQRRLIARKCGRRTLILEDDLLTWLHTLPSVQSEVALGSIPKEGGR